MTALRRFDAWLGLRLFLPPIVWVCQRAGITQWAFYRYSWWIFALWIVWRDDHDSALRTVIFVLGALIRTFGAGLVLNEPAPEDLRFRPHLLAFWGIEILMAIAAGELSEWTFVPLVPLFAEYATTIATIPPRPKRESVAHAMAPNPHPAHSASGSA